MQAGGDSNFNSFGVNDPPFPSPNPGTPVNPPLQPPQVPMAPAGAPVQFQQPPIVPSGTDDIILAPDESKKSTKTPIIILIVIVIITLIAAIAFAISRVANPGSSGDEVETPATEINLPPREAYERFADYIFWGPSKSSDVTDDIKRSDIPPENTYLWNLIRIGSYEDHQEGFQTIMDNLGILQRSMENNTEISASLSELGYNLTDLNYLTATTQTDIMLKKYLENKESGMQEYLDEISKTNLIITNDIANNLLDKLTPLYAMLDQYGCLNQGEIDYDCYNGIDSEELSRLQSDIESIESKAIGYAHPITNWIVEQTKAMNEVINE